LILITPIEPGTKPLKHGGNEDAEELKTRELGGSIGDLIFFFDFLRASVSPW